jgi:pimeloyl-ACP methyl ester carboxylesterase
MWLGIFSGVFSVPALLGLLLCVWNTARALKRRERFPWGWATLAALILTGRNWIRLQRRAGPDEPRRLTPDKRGTAQSFDGLRLEWEQFGPDDKPVIVLTHGWSLTHDTWYYQKKALAGEFRVIVWDMRGEGRSETPSNGDYTMETIAADLAAIFDAVGAERHPSGCVLAGHSVGAMILPLFAAQFPERMAQVRGLALLGGTDSPLLEAMWGREWLVPMRSWFWEPLARCLARFPRPFEVFVSLIHQLGCIHAALMLGTPAGYESRGQNDLVADRCAHFSMRAAGLGALACFAFDTRAAMAAISVPTLILTGESDRNMPPDSQQAMAARLPNAEVVILPQCGHLALLECHAEVSTRLTDFARHCLQSPK